MTAREIIARARLSVNDTDLSNPRWSDTDLIGYLNDGIREFVRVRPDFNIAADGSLSAVSAVAGLGDTVSFPRNLLVPLADYVSEQVFSEDSADSGNMNRAKWHRGRWTAVVVGG